MVSSARIILGSSGEYGRLIKQECYKNSDDVLLIQRHPEKNFKEDRLDYLERWHNIDLTKPDEFVGLVAQLKVKNIKIDTIFNFSRVSDNDSLDSILTPFELSRPLFASVIVPFYISQIMIKYEVASDNFCLVIPYGDQRIDNTTLFVESCKLNILNSLINSSEISVPVKTVKLPPRDEYKLGDIEKLYEFVVNSKETGLALT